mmetsp:Transcript_39993/g.35319  ORF Transcript_39993/g.35319 Transcript_39993/m.35319 type:complete len:286 (-) Transcript_39993:126-983(-)
MAEQKTEQKEAPKEKVNVVARLEITSKENVDAFLLIIEPVIAKTNKEQGCIEYNIHQDKKNELNYLLVEQWECQSDLDAHLKAPHITPLFTEAFAKICKVIGPYFCKPEPFKNPKESLIGKTIPTSDVYIQGDDGPTKVSTDKLFNDKKVIVFAVPGPFTSTCQNKQAPTYIEKYDELKKIADDVYMLAATDGHILNAFNKEIKGDGKLGTIADFDASFCKALGGDVTSVDLSPYGMGLRASRFSFYAVNGIIQNFHVEPDLSKMTITDAQTLLKGINAFAALTK